MLVNFSLQNWMSFRDRTTFSMLSSREQQHGERVPRIKKYNVRILPIAAIYGGNASGKSNLFAALSFVSDFVTKGVLPDDTIPVIPFRLDEHSLESPTIFDFDLLVDDTLYEFSFSITNKSVIEEKLVINYSTKQIILYHRKKDKITFDKKIGNEQLKFVFHGTRDNQLFLTNSISQKVNNFRPIYDWFKKKLNLIAPDSRFKPFERFIDVNHPLYKNMCELLPKLDTGITRLGGEEIPIEHTDIPIDIRNKLGAEVSEGKSIKVISDYVSDRFIITKKDSKLIAKKLFTYHPSLKGEEIRFEMGQESDGSQRLIDLIPAFVELANPESARIFVIDELDRSLHTLLLRKLLELYLSNCSHATRSQLLFTTHDVLLMDQQILRRDEMWVSERDVNGISQLISFGDYKDIRYDKDIRKSYLQGRLGGIPRILMCDSISNSFASKSEVKNTDDI